MTTLAGPMMQRLIRQQWEREHPFKAWVERHADEIARWLVWVAAVITYAVVLAALRSK